VPQEAFRAGVEELVGARPASDASHPAALRERRQCNRTSHMWPSLSATPQQAVPSVLTALCILSPAHIQTDVIVKEWNSLGPIGQCGRREATHLWTGHCWTSEPISTTEELQPKPVLHSPLMANQTLSPDLRRYAVAGAQARLAEISLEREAIRRAFPELRENGSSGGRTRQSAVDSASEPASGGPRRRTMTAAQRKAVGERMKKYWAARRGASETTGTTSSDSTERASKPAAGAAKRSRRNMSPEARKRISDAQKARWAKQRGEEKATEVSSGGGTSAAAAGRRTAKRSAKSAKPGPRKVSAAARKRMSQAQKKRWAAKRKAA